MPTVEFGEIEMDWGDDEDYPRRYRVVISESHLSRQIKGFGETSRRPDTLVDATNLGNQRTGARVSK